MNTRPQWYMATNFYIIILFRQNVTNGLVPCLWILHNITMPTLLWQLRKNTCIYSMKDMDSNWGEMAEENFQANGRDFKQGLPWRPLRGKRLAFGGQKSLMSGGGELLADHPFSPFDPFEILSTKWRTVGVIGAIRKGLLAGTPLLPSPVLDLPTIRETLKW